MCYFLRKVTLFVLSSAKKVSSVLDIHENNNDFRFLKQLSSVSCRNITAMVRLMKRKNASDNDVDGGAAAGPSNGKILI